MSGGVETIATEVELDLGQGVREANAALRAAAPGERFRLRGAVGQHQIAVGLRAAIEVEICGSAGYYAAGLSKAARVTIDGDCGAGVAENLMSGEVAVAGSAGAAAGASAHGGRLTILGDAGGRCGISLKGADLVVAGSVGAGCGFMAQSGRIVIAGDAGEGLGDSIYEARIYVCGEVGSLGADCVEKELRDEHLAELRDLLEPLEAGLDPCSFRRYGSARRLYGLAPVGEGEA